MKIAAGIAALYLIIVVLMALAQDRLLLPRWAMGSGVALPATAERLGLSLASGEELVGVHLPKERPSPEGSALVLGFGGNAWDADALALYLHSLFPDRGVAAFHYRGYAPSTGEPSARAILEDAVTIYDYVVVTLAPDQVVAVGLSLGARPAAELARQRPIAGLIIVTPFDSLRALAHEHYPWLPVGLLLRHHIEVADTPGGRESPGRAALGGPRHSRSTSSDRPPSQLRPQPSSGPCHPGGWPQRSLPAGGV